MMLPLKQAGARNTLSHRYRAYGESAVMGTSIAHRVPIRCSVLICFRLIGWNMPNKAHSGVVGISGKLTAPTCLRDLPRLAKINP
jgi:hypothetical protein